MVVLGKLLLHIVAFISELSEVKNACSQRSRMHAIAAICQISVVTHIQVSRC